MTERFTKEQLLLWLDQEEVEFFIDKFRQKHEISPECSMLYTNFNRFCEQKIIRRLGRGWYRKVKKVKPIRWWEADENKYFDLVFPRSHTDDSSFEFEEAINLSPGDLIVLSGVSNTGKSTIALNILAENIDKFPCVLMGNEYTTLDGMPSPKFKRRMMRMKWAQWLNGNGDAKFDLLPIREHFEDHVQPGKINIVDWINLVGDFWAISKVTEDLKAEVGDGLLVAVLQKAEDAVLARGKDFSRDFADVYFTIDPYGEYESRLTVGKVKDPKCRVTGRSWAFCIVDGGANLHNIREIKKCPRCFGRGWIQGKECEMCHTRKFVDK